MSSVFSLVGGFVLLLAAKVIKANCRASLEEYLDPSLRWDDGTMGG